MPAGSEDERPELEDLSVRPAWVRGLALAMARDAHLADDLSQESWLAWLRGGPREPASLARWFTGTLRNLLRLRRRSEARRGERERLAVPSRPPLAPELALERIEIQEVLLRAVRELEEPYRSTVVLRWLEELEPLEIARRTGVPVRTVHTRVTRALERLRKRLEGELRGGDRSWFAAWIALLPQEPPTANGALIVNAKTKLAVLGTSLAALTAAVVALRPWVASAVSAEAASPQPVALDRVGSAETAESAEAMLAPTTVDPRAPVDGLTFAAPASEAATVPVRVVHGTALDIRGIPVAGARVEFTASGALHGARGAASVVTNGLGAFELELQASSGTLRAADERWTTVLEARVDPPDPESGYVLVLAPRCALQGRVVDPTGEPIEGAELRIDRPGVRYLPADTLGLERRRFGQFRRTFADPLRSSLPATLDASVAADWFTRSGPEGRFRFDDAPEIAGARIVASKQGYLPVAKPSSGAVGPIEIVLQRSIDVPGRIRGRVVGAQGKALDRVQVFLGSRSTWTDGKGRFELDAVGSEGTRLVAIGEGRAPVIQACLGATADAPDAWPDPLVIVLSEGGSAIRGSVLGPDGQPMASVEVSPLERPTLSELLAWAGETFDRHDAQGTQAIGSGSVRTNAQGLFELSGLPWHECRLRAIDRSTLDVVTTAPIRMGTDGVVIRLGERAQLARYAGRVVDLRGRPIAAARVSLRRTLPSPGADGATILELDAVTTDSAGRFEIESAAADLDTAQVQVESSAPWELVPLGPGDDRQALVLRVGRLGRIVVELAPEDSGVDGFRVLDAQGNDLGLGARQGGGLWVGRSPWPIGPGGRSEPVLVSETGVTLVFTQRGNERARLPIRVVPGEVTVVRP